MHSDHDKEQRRSADEDRQKAKALRFLAKERVAEYLRGLADNVENGEIFVEDESAAVFLKAPDEVYLEVEAKSRKSGGSFELKISWSDECKCGCGCRSNDDDSNKG